jgi:hypothetical protein
MAINGADGPSVFARYIEKTPTPAEPTPSAIPPPALKLLNWLQRGWGKPVITAEHLYQYGPGIIRDKKSALEAADALEKRGWLIPLKTKRYDARKWRIMQGFD